MTSSIRVMDLWHSPHESASGVHMGRSQACVKRWRHVFLELYNGLYGRVMRNRKGRHPAAPPFPIHPAGPVE